VQAVVYWIRAKMLLGETQSVFNPAAAFICCEDESEQKKGTVFFVPLNLSNRCLYVEESKQIVVSKTNTVSEKGHAYSSDVLLLDRYNSPDLTGMDAAAFCAGAMLYRILTKTLPYPDDATIFQDMREGIFLPIHLAVPGLNKELCSLIQSALMLPVGKTKPTGSGTNIISKLLHLLIKNENEIVDISSLFKQTSQTENTRLEKEKKLYLFRQNTYKKTKRFVNRNKPALFMAGLVLLIFLFIFANTRQSASLRPTTTGMYSKSVVTAYYEAFSLMDHLFMEACVQGSAGKDDIDLAIKLYAVTKARQAHEMTATSPIIPAKTWLENGGDLPAPNAFGVTDLTIEPIAGKEGDDRIIYRTSYTLWSPEMYFILRTDTLTLNRDKKGNWKITEILREHR
jgi:hypothetical protein